MPHAVKLHSIWAKFEVIGQISLKGHGQSF